jgi:hypothetical protein
MKKKNRKKMKAKNENKRAKNYLKNNIDEEET